MNTNRRADPSGQDEQAMLKNGFVALYFDGYKEKIDLLNEGDIVFLYGNSRGVIAFGEVHGPTKILSYKNMNKFKGEEYRRKLKNFVELPMPFSSGEIKKLFGKKVVLAKAFFQLDDTLGAILLAELRRTSRTLKAA